MDFSDLSTRNILNNVIEKKLNRNKSSHLCEIVSIMAILNGLFVSRIN